MIEKLNTSCFVVDIDSVKHILETFTKFRQCAVLKIVFFFVFFYKTGFAFFIRGSCYFLENCLVLQWLIPFYIKKSHACNV